MLLHDAVCVFPAQSGLRQGKQHALAVHKTSCTLQIFLHPLGMDHEPIHNLLCAREREIERDCCVGRNEAFDRRMRDVALVPQRHVLQRRDNVTAHDARESRDVLRQNRISLVRHGGRTLLPFRKEFLCFEHFRTLQVTDFRRQPLE